MKTLKSLLMLGFILGLSMNRVSAQVITFTEDWTDYHICTDCMEEIAGTLTVEVKIANDKNVKCKGGGVLYGVESGDPYEVSFMNPGWITFSDTKGIEWTFIELIKIRKNGKLVCTAQRTSILRSDADGNFQFIKGHEIYNCK